MDARFVIGSFGNSKAYNEPAFQLTVARNPDEPVPSVEVSRYGKLPEIHHIFKSDPQSPPVIVTLVFIGMVLAAFPILGGLVSLSSKQQGRYSDSYSGSSLASTSIICRLPLSLPQFPTPSSWDPWFPSSTSSSSTTHIGHSSRFFQLSQRPASSHSSVAAALSVKYRADALQVSDRCAYWRFRRWRDALVLVWPVLNPDIPYPLHRVKNHNTIP